MGVKSVQMQNEIKKVGCAMSLEKSPGEENYYD